MKKFKLLILNKNKFNWHLILTWFKIFAILKIVYVIFIYACKRNKYKNFMKINYKFYS